MNSAFERLAGFAGDEALGKNLRELTKSGCHDSLFYRPLWDTIISGRVWCGEIINKRKSGEFYTEEMTITPVLDAADHNEHCIAIKSDIPGRIISKERLESSLREKKNWSGRFIIV